MLQLDGCSSCLPQQSGFEHAGNRRGEKFCLTTGLKLQVTVEGEKKKYLTWNSSVGSIEALKLHRAISDKMNGQEVCTRNKKGRNGVSAKCPNQREVNIVNIIHLVEINKC